MEESFEEIFLAFLHDHSHTMIEQGYLQKSGLGSAKLTKLARAGLRETVKKADEIEKYKEELEELLALIPNIKQEEWKQKFRSTPKQCKKYSRMRKLLDYEFNQIREVVKWYYAGVQPDSYKKLAKNLLSPEEFPAIFEAYYASSAEEEDTSYIS